MEIKEDLGYRQLDIHSKGFDMRESGSINEYGKVKVGLRSLDDAILSLGSLKQTNKNYGDKAAVLKAIDNVDVEALRAISNFFFRTNGIYFRTCNYFATMYRYDWWVTSITLDKKINNDKVVNEFNQILYYLDNSNIKKTCGDIALQTIVNGAFYGYRVMLKDRMAIQELPIAYCRSRYQVGDMPVIEFNMKYFDDQFTDVGYRMRVLKMFPEDFQKGYALYKQKKLGPDYSGDTRGDWYMLSPGLAFKFSVTPLDIPMFINAIPALIDLDAAQDLDRRKQMQKLLKIIVQKLPLDKNGELIFDVDEARDIHNNAVAMLSRAIGVDVLTTFTDVEDIDLSDSAAAAGVDDLARSERTAYNAFGVSQNIFNADGNLSLQKSILSDEAQFRTMLLQFKSFYDQIVRDMSKNPKKYVFRFEFLETTQYNYQEMSKMYKDQAQMGFPKLLSQIALGQSQNSILHSMYFENEILKLHEIMIPPMLSSTMNSETILGKTNQTDTKKSQNITEDSKGGRPANAEDERSEKTIHNQERLS